MNFKIINEISYNEKNYPFAVSVWGLERIEEATGKDLVEIAQSNKIEVSKAKIKFGLMAGAKNQKKEVTEITDELVDDMIMNIEGLLGNAIYTYSVAFSKFYNIQEEGN